MKKIILDVAGMHCASCENLIKEDLEDEEGIISAEASQKDGKVTVEYDESKISEERIRKIILSDGFEPK